MKVQILMSTFNGERYIRTQLDSIIRQNVEPKTLLIRDDGSTDNTLKIIKEYQKTYPWISFYQGRNIGVQRSFFDLLINADADADYIAIADQDDQWMPEKLERAITCLEKMCSEENGPVLYCGSQQMVGENLEPLSLSVSRIVDKPGFGNALVQNICTGCTAVMNQELLQLMREHMPEDIDAIVMHDWWFYLTASCFGKVFYDDTPYIKYRQHQKNVHGAILNKRALLKYRLGQLLKPRGEIYQQAREFKKCFCPVLEQCELKQEVFLLNKLILADHKFKNRVSVAFDKRYFRQKKTDDMVFRGIVLIGKL